MSYIHKTSGQYGISERDIRALPQYATRSWPTPFRAPDEYAWTFPTPQPVYDAITHAVREIAPALSTKGEYEQQWEVYALDAETVATNLANAIATARTSALNRINTEYTVRTSVIAHGYPDYERESWPVQIEEANALLADDTASTPWIDAAATSRGITRLDLAQRIKSNDLMYRTIHGGLSGQRQGLEDQIAAIADGPDAPGLLNAIKWPDPA